MNSLLQIFFNTELFKRNIMLVDPLNKLEYNNPLYQLQILLGYLTCSQRNYIKPNNLKAQLPLPFNTSFCQQDVSEFLRFYVDELERNLNTVNQKDLIKDIFVGKMKSTIQCQNNHFSTQETEYYDLMLTPIISDSVQQTNNPEKTENNISNLLKNLTMVEDIDDFYCNICDNKVLAKKKEEIFSAPNHLIIT